ncbi:nitrous oxide reductase family maturation protein NosD [Novispirillum sp. DQ9]|uniref:nitrous oxide reductase family maturation protein NosD n=1 Tax=Novispirillum sp. DQ9 TaxID=3398612 RepID=UPI003C7A01DD
MRAQYVTAAAPALVGLALVGWCAAAQAGETVVPAGGTALAGAIAAAPAGAVLRLAPGVHAGPLVIDRPLTLIGDDGAIIDGGGTGSVVRVEAPGVTLRGIALRGSGIDLPARDSAILLDKAASGAVIEGNRVTDSLIGVTVWGPRDVIVRDNVIRGRSDLRISEQGDGVSIWNAPGTRVEGNDIAHSRDGVRAVTGRDVAIVGNSFRDLRFAVHFMYTNDSEVSRNRSTGNDLGYALMFSGKLDVRGNLSENDRDHGIALNYANDSVFVGNVVRNGGDKCVFIYNSNKNAFRDNLFEGCGIGVHFTAGSEGNIISGNGFIANRVQVMYVSTRRVDWSHGGRGNYWSDNPAFDLDGDGIADQPYRPNDIVDRVVWAVPLAKLLLNSPAVQVVRWAQAQFPAVSPGGVVDGAPLMRPPAPGEDSHG